MPPLLLLLLSRCADSQDEQGRWNNYHDDHDHKGHSIDWWAQTPYLAAQVRCSHAHNAYHTGRLEAYPSVKIAALYYGSYPSSSVSVLFELYKIET
jgi:hypothetical protein